MIKLDLVPSSIKPVLHASQYDDGRQWECQILNDGTPYVFQSGDTVDYTIRKGDGLLVTGAVAVTPGSSTITLVSTEQMCAVFGSNLGELTITSNGTKIGSVNFIVEVERAPDENGITSQSEINNLNRQITDEVDRILPDMVDEVAEPIINEKVPEKVAELVPSAVATVAEPIVREIAPLIVAEQVPIVIGNNYYNKTQTDELLNAKAPASEVDELQNAVTDIDNTLTVTTVKKESINQLDINTLTRGTLSYNGNVTENPTADYWVTPFIAVKKNDYVHAIFGTTEGTIQRISQYNSNKGFISNVNSQTKYQISGDNVAFVRLQLYKSILNNVRSMVAVTETADQPSFEWCYKPYLKTVGTRERIDIYAEDGIENFWLKMQEAFYKGDCDVFIHKGEYVYTNELIDKIRFLNRRGVPIGGGCLYYFDVGANVTCEYTGTNVNDVAGYFSPLDSWNVSGSWDFYNLTLVAKNVVYAFHDEADGEEEPFRHSLNRCYITLDNSAIGEQSSALSKCVGGGLGLHSEIYINNCVFSTTNPNSEHGEDVSYHKANGRAYSDAIIVVDGCYFGGTFRCDMDYSPVPAIVPRVIACGNSALGINAYQCDARIWNNEIRT